MMFFEPEQMEDTPIAPVTRTSKLAQKVEAITEQIDDGNTIRYVTGVNATVATTALVLGSTALSPLVSLLFLVGCSGAVSAYCAYVLHEAAKLKINPVWLPTTSGEVDQVLMEILPTQEKILWTAIDNFGLEAVEDLERQGHLDYLLRSIKAIKVRSTETATEDFNNAIEQIAWHYFPQQRTLPNLPQCSSLGTSGDAPRSRVRIAPPEDSGDSWGEVEDNHRTSDRLPVATIDNLPPVRDLPHEIASLRGHVVLVARTTAGKSTCLVQVIKHCLDAGHHVLTLDGKGCLPLRDAGGVYRHVNTIDRAIGCLQDIRSIVNMLKNRQELAMKGHTDFTPQTIVVDEINLIRKFLKRDSPESLNDFTEMLAELLLQGASYKIFLRLSSHSSRLKNLGLDGGEADSLSFIALGRNGSFESLEDLLEFQITGRKAKKYQDELDNLTNETFKETLVFSTIAPMGFYRLPWVDQSSAVLAPKQELDIRSSLDRLYQSATAPEATSPIEDTPKTPSKIDSLSDEALEDLLQKVLTYARRKEKVKPSDVSAGLRSCRGYSAPEIMQLFDYLVESGSGCVRGNEFIPN